MRTETRRWTAISAGGLAVLLGAIDTYVVVTIMTDVMKDVGIALNEIQRVAPIITGYLLGYIAAMPLLGRASDRFGRKLVLQLGLAGFLVGSIITSLAGEIDMPGDNGNYYLLLTGRVLQGISSGALLPVTLALAADLWTARDRATILGGVGAAQELGAVLGPAYGFAILALFHHWPYAFWINVPLTLLAMALIHTSLPDHDPGDGPRQRVDIVGGVLLALALGLATWGLYNPKPDGKQVLPPNGLLLVGLAIVVTVVFFVWEWRARTKLIDPAGVRFIPFSASLGASLCAGAALMVTLVNIELFGQGVLQLDLSDTMLKLTWFLAALPIGALLGGWLATRVGDRIVAFAGLAIAAGGYWLISGWGVNALEQQHDLVVLNVPAMPTDLAISGFGLGLVIGPLTSAALRVVPAAQHGIASSLVIVARMTGMLVGVAALSAWGLYRFNQILAGMPPIEGGSFAEKAASQARQFLEAYAQQFGEMFAVTAVVCVVGALLGLLIAGRNTHVEETDLTEDELDDATTVLSIGRDRSDLATERITRSDPDATTRLPRGAHRRR